MSPHVTSQLGVFLDGELAAPERAAVAAHLRECDACARQLEEMAAVDDAARSQVVEAPEGYFDDFVSRVRARLRAPAKRRSGPPVWALAVAAALVLAVVTPVTLHRMTAPSGPAAFQAPAALQDAERPQAAPPASLEQHAARAEPEAKKALKDAAPPAPLEKRRAVSLDEKVGGARSTDDRAAGRLAAPPPALARAAAAPSPAKEETGKPEATRDEPVPASAPAATRNGFAGAAAESLEEDAVKSKATVRADAEAARERRRQPAQAGAGAFTAAELRYRSLLARRVSTVAEARSLREAWRGFAQAEPAGPRSDEARVRVIEVGAEAFRLSGEESDRAVVERDAAAYLARPDATQAERVRALLPSP